VKGKEEGYDKQGQERGGDKYSNTTTGKDKRFLVMGLLPLGKKGRKPEGRKRETYRKPCKGAN